MDPYTCAINKIDVSLLLCPLKVAMDIQTKEAGARLHFVDSAAIIVASL